LDRGDFVPTLERIGVQPAGEFPRALKYQLRIFQ